ncbi:5-methylcytosine-specific restriction endonuclease McrA [Flavobacterium sp. HSC-32F16]|uniref:hypothetical protein n=1 Tax=Flavobacterium sp. HSC-32F16 TaxID=2910964 RepID=UPI0020A3A879|nr:hypothetical protein [Flavobacterium sp. HSC-32F16]MCP2025517.1 5-methylcytosine-specific restriction endonuclease McrA [Flavobacterium sp. HSC-32F16]
MEYINKINSSGLLAFFSTFESNKWSSVTPNYNNYNYNFTSNEKSDIKRVLLLEQNNLCCYCMKKLNLDEATIEHLYPQNPSLVNIFNNYGLTGKCVEKLLFDYNVRAIPNAGLTNLPHDISYYNLLACCSKCNNFRGSKEIKPFVFDLNVNNDFNYNDSGNIYSSIYFSDIAAIGLAFQYYIDYRKLWRYIKNNNKYSVTNLSSRSDLIKAIKFASLSLHNKNDKNFFFIELSTNGLLQLEALKYIYFLD